MSDDKSAVEPTEPIDFHYIKAPNCSELVVHGVYGGINLPTGQFHMAVFSERPPIPRIVKVVPDENGNVAEISREGKAGVIRSVNAVLHFDINTAIALRDWLNSKVEAFEAEHPELFEVKS